MEVAHGLLALHGQEPVGQRADILLGAAELGRVHRRTRARLLRGQVVADGVRDDEVAVGETLHEGRCAEAVRTVVGEVRLTQDKQAREIRHEVIVHPEAAHRVVHGGIDAHRHLVGVLGGDLVVDVEEIAVALAHAVFAEPLDGVGEVEVHAEAALTDSPALVAHTLGGAGRDVTRAEIAEARIDALEIVVAILLRDRPRRLETVLLALRHPDAAVVAERLRHQGQLRLVFAADRDARRVDLRVARVRHAGAALVGAPDRGDVRAAGVGGEIEDIAVAARREHDGVGRVAGDLTGHEVADDDALRLAIDDDEVEHLAVSVELDGAGTDHARQRGVRAEQQLLAGLAAGIERAAHLGAAERAVGEQAAVFTGERHALGHALVDDVDGHLGETVNVGLARTVVAALDRVVEQPVNRVAVVLVILRGVDASLRGDGVRAPRAVVEHEVLHLVAQLGEGRRRGGAGQAGADDDDLVLPLVGRVDELDVALVLAPLVGERAGGNLGVEFGHDGNSLVGGDRLDGRDGRVDLAEQDRAGDGGVGEEVDDAERDRDPAEAVRPFFRAPAERLEHAVEAVQQVDAQQADRDEVEERHQRVLEAAHHHAVHVEHLGAGVHHREAGDLVVLGHRVVRQVLLERGRLRRADREVREMVEQERQHHHARPAHEARGECRPDGVRHAVRRAARRAVFQRQHRGRPDVDRGGREQEKARAPEQRPETVQEGAVAVDVVRVLEDLQVSDQMADDETDEDHACDRHEELPPNGGTKQSTYEVHYRIAKIGGVTGRENLG